MSPGSSPAAAAALFSSTRDPQPSGGFFQPHAQVGAFQWRIEAALVGTAERVSEEEQEEQEVSHN